MHTRIYPLFIFAALIWASAGHASTCALPVTLTNGSVADANQVMSDFNAVNACLSAGTLTIPPVPSLQITGPGGAVTIQAPAISSSYNFNLPTLPGSSGQVLVSGGGGSTSMYWSTIPGIAQPPLADGIPVARPAASAFTQRNLGGTTIADHTNGPITLTIPPQATDQIVGIEQPVPSSGPYTITAKISQFVWNENNPFSGVYVVDSTGKLITLAILQGSNYVVVEHWNSVSSFNSHGAVAQSSPITAAWLRINNDGTNFNYYVSSNGVDWIKFSSEPNTSFLGSAIVGAGVAGDNDDVGNLQLNMTVSVWSFEVASGTGTNSHW